MGLSDSSPSEEPPRQQISLTEWQDVLDRTSLRRMREFVGYTLFALFLIIIGVSFGVLVLSAPGIAVLPLVLFGWALKTLGLIAVGFLIFVGWLFPKAKP